MRSAGERPRGEIKVSDSAFGLARGAHAKSPAPSPGAELSHPNRRLITWLKPLGTPQVPRLIA